MSDTPTQHPADHVSPNKWYDILIYGLIALFIGVLFAIMTVRAYYDVRNDYDRVTLVPYVGTLTDDDHAIIEQASDILMRAEAAQTSAERILSFLEGASVLIGGALAVATIYGFRSTQETRNDLRNELAGLKALQKQVADALPLLEQVPGQLETMSAYRENLAVAQTKIDSLEALSTSLNTRIENIMLALSDLIQANQELLLRNHEEAHADVLRVLERMPDNPLALYIAGWIEFQYLENRFEAGLARMERAYELAPANPTIIAAYGVVKRRQAVQIDGTVREQLFSEAEGLLLKALNANPRLLDMNQESFWGPVAGLRRDQGRLEQAIEAYENAVVITPGSSYPRGNLAALYLCQHRAKRDPKSLDLALHHFEQTLVYAKHELAAFSNDYFHLMDLAMSGMILGIKDKENLRTALRQLDDVLALRPTVEMLQTSRRGWYFLKHAAPDEWTVVQRGIDRAIQKIETQINAQGGTPLAIQPTPLCGNAPQETINDAS